MAASVHTTPSRCTSISRALLVGSLCVFALAVVLFPITVVFWPFGALLAACGLLIRILGIQQISLAAWMTMTLLLSAAILTGLASAESSEYLLQQMGLLTILPTLVVWVLGTFACWLFVDHALKPETIGQKCAHFAICLLGPPAIVGAIVCTAGSLICLLALPVSGGLDTFVLSIVWAAFAGLSWMIVVAFRHLIRCARTRNLSMRRAGLPSPLRGARHDRI